MQQIPDPTQDPAWILASEGYDPIRERSIESRFTISNGALGVRGGRVVTRGARWVVPAKTYVAGLFDVPATDHGVPALVPAADWLRFRVLLAGGPMQFLPGDQSSHRMTLDMRQGALLSEGRHSIFPDIEFRARSLRLVSIDERAVGMQLIEIEFDSGSAEITFEASIDQANHGLTTEHIDHDLAVWRAQQSGKRLAMAVASSLQVDGVELAPGIVGGLSRTWTWRVHPGQVVRFERQVAIVRGDSDGPDPGRRAREKLASAHRAGSRRTLEAHVAAWSDRWHSSDVQIRDDSTAQRALRFAIYHLNSAANPGDERVSIGARALTGDDYHGHVFWDTEIFLLPFYSLTWPEAARTLLMYRFHTLAGARAKAAGMGWRGALYAWESADTGAETTPDQVVGPDQQIVDVLCGRQEQHISADVAYAVWQYWQATRDEAFLCDAGAEILLETARFWASRAQQEADGRCHIRCVIGPDEYHEHIDDNAYTNVMARWNIRRALDVVSLLRQRWPDCWARLSDSIDLNDSELTQWRDVADRLQTGLDAATGMFEQFAGYFTLEDIDLAPYAGRSVPVDMVLGRERTQNSQLVKQADVVALLALLPEEFPGGAAERNFRYYEPRCGHGSSLSPAMHGMVAARLGDAEMAMRYFRKAAAIDLADTHVSTDGGVHIAALGGIWMLAVLGFAGVSLRDDGLGLDPHPPADWGGIACRVQWRGRMLRIRIDQDEDFVEATLEQGEPMTVLVRGERQELRQDLPIRVPGAGAR